MDFTLQKAAPNDKSAMIDTVNKRGNIAEILLEKGHSVPQSVAFSSEKRDITYSQLSTIAEKAAFFLDLYGCREKTVIFLFDDELLLLAYMFGASMLGITFCSLSATSSEFAVTEIAERIDASIILSEFQESDVVSGYEKLIVSLEELEKSTKTYKEVLNEPNRIWQYLVGSGTTGKSKIIPLTHAQMLHRIALSSDWLPIAQKDRVGMMVHLNFNAAKTVCLSTFAAGATVVAMHNETRPWIEQKVTILYSSVFHIRGILKLLPESAEGYFKGLKILLIGGSSVSDRLRQEIFTKLTPNLYVRYGINEISSASVAVLKGKNSLSGSVGKPIKGVSVEVVDHEERIVERGVIGNIRIRSKGMVNGYVGDEEATRQAFRNGWFYPGDLGYFSHNGELIHCGRSDQMMIYNGINIYPLEIEAALLSHPSIIDAVAFPLHHDVHQDIPVCAVVLKKKALLNKDEIKKYADDRLGSKTARKIIIVDEIPRNDRGKPIRKALFERLKESSEVKHPPLSEPIQPTYRFSIQIQRALAFDSVRLSRWFGDILKIETSAGEEDFQFADAGLKLTLQLLHYANFPVFYGKVATCTRENESVKLDLWIGIMDDIPQQWYKEVINGAYRSCSWMVQNDPSEKTINELYHSFEQIVKPLKKRFPIGKSTLPLLREAYRRGIPFIHVGGGVFQLGWGANGRKFDRSTTDGDSALGSNLSHNKMIASGIVRRSGLPAPIYGLSGTYSQALAIAKKIGWPIVVKPVDQDRGEGVSVGIWDETALKKGFEAALSLSPSKRVIIEKQVGGVCHRLFIAGGKLLYAVKRLPKSVLGDGQRSIAQLIQQGNEEQKISPPWHRTEPFVQDEITLSALNAQGYSLDSVAPRGEWIALRDIESTRYGGRDEDVSECVHPANLEIAIKAAQIFELEVAGVDIITKDISIPWYENGAIINEVNYAPLLGGGEISRSRIGEYIGRFIQKEGRIPVEVLIGGEEAMDEALRRRTKASEEGYKCFLTSHCKTYDDGGGEIIMPLNTLYERMRVLIMDKRVERLIIVVQNDEVTVREFLLDRIDKAEYFQGEMKSVLGSKAPLTSEEIETIRQTLIQRSMNR